MSAPDTNIKTQQKRHKPALLGILFAVALVLGLLFAFVTFVVDQGGAPEGANAQIDGRTGAIIEGDSAAQPAGN